MTPSKENNWVKQAARGGLKQNTSFSFSNVSIKNAPVTVFKEQGEETQEDRFLTKLPSYPILKDNSQIMIIVTSTHMSIQEVLLRFTEGTINPVFNTPWLLTGRGYQQSHSSLELQIARVSWQSNYTPQGINPKATTRVTEQITGVSFYILTPQL